MRADRERQSMTIHDCHDFHAFSALRRSNLRPATLRHHVESIRTIFAAISMLAFARVGGRALPLDLAPEAAWVGVVGGCIGSIGASRDSVWNRRDDSGVRP